MTRANPPVGSFFPLENFWRIPKFEIRFQGESPPYELWRSLPEQSAGWKIREKSKILTTCGGTVEEKPRCQVDLHRRLILTQGSDF
ncbi:hypothetical protein AKJ43_02610 [candidate division MSBL1 archaeon SCGC-AAA261D19]|uniref:Uncharacterized protein n=1 Tax=candidate division MSBL1 archaeon SCGC-AAA261D19 TaxID=1698273 RepID=A0A133V6F7_9EURY|nr:hypothetical protein AKJ43_02610 [candidate division MSBL1 archaeon SCGC-AAA261D19]